MKKSMLFFGAFLALAALVSNVNADAYAAPPSLINIHGQLLAPTGTPLSGIRDFQITFYDAETDGNVLGTTLSGVTTLSADGLFNIAVAPPAEILLAPEVWYELGIDTDEPTDSDASDDLFPNRVRLFSVPFALQAQEVVGVDADRVGNGNVDNTEFDALDGVSSNIQSQIDAIDTSGIATNASDIADNTAAIALKANSADVYTQAEIDAQQGLQDSEIALKANSADVYTQAEIDTQQGLQDSEIALKANSADVYTQAEIDTQQGLQDTAIAAKANSADVYTQAEIDTQQGLQDTAIAAKANSADVYTQAQIDTQQGLQDTAIAAKANSADVYTQAEIDTQQGLQDTAIAAKANSADVYTQAEIDTQQGLQDTAIAAKANSADVFTQTQANTNFVNATGDTMSGALAVGTVNEASGGAGVTVDGVLLRDGALNLPGNTIEIASATAPGVTTNKLYNTGGNLFWSGTQLNGGGGGGTSVDTISYSANELRTGDGGDTLLTRKILHSGTIVSIQAWSAFQDSGSRFDVQKNGSSIISGAPVAWNANNLVEPTITSSSVAPGDIISIVFTAGTGDIYQPSVSIIVEYN